jgi:hypothetical protein
MKDTTAKQKLKESCCDSVGASCKSEGLTEFLPIYNQKSEDEVCCGPPAGPASSVYERPGYDLCPFVETFTQTPIGAIPKIKTELATADRFGSVKVRLGLNRDQYKVAPGLYCLGDATETSPVLVTANYKLTFDILRKELSGLDAWILVLDTRGINVWCAAGKKTFSTQEVIQRVKQTRLAEVVSHKKLILPQLSATGVSARQVRRGCGFKVLWGPIRASDIRSFIQSGMQAEKDMRMVAFTLPERLVLIPVELYFLRKYLLWVLLASFLLSGIGTDLFSIHMAWSRGLILMIGCLLGIFAGAVAAPLMLPWIPVRTFALKGLITGLALSMAMLLGLGARVNLVESVTLILLIVTVSSYLAMNFTGSTPYTSPSGVEKEMRVAIPIQAVAMLLVPIGWLAAPFIM